MKREKKKKQKCTQWLPQSDLLSPTTINSHHFLLTRKLNSVSSFTLPFTCHLQLQTRSGMKRNKNTKKGEQRLGFGGFGGVKFKFVIPHVQVNIKKCYKSTRTTLLSTRQIKGRSSPPPGNLLKKGACKLAGQLALSVMQCTVSTLCIVCVQLLTSLYHNVSKEQL